MVLHVGMGKGELLGSSEQHANTGHLSFLAPTNGVTQSTEGEIELTVTSF